MTALPLEAGAALQSLSTDTQQSPEQRKKKNKKKVAYCLSTIHFHTGDVQ